MDIRQALKDSVVPVLRAQGFAGSFPHFRRPRQNRMELLTFQFAKYGSGDFVVELATCPSEGVTFPWGEHVPANRANAHHLYTRHRLGSEALARDPWFSANWFLAEPSAATAELARLLEQEGAKYWAQSADA